MAKPKKPEPKSVMTLTLTADKRKNIPTTEYQPVVGQNHQQSVRVADHRRNRDLDPQLMWRGKDEQDWSDLVVLAPPLFIQEKVHPKVLIDHLLRRTKESRRRVHRVRGGDPLRLRGHPGRRAGPARRQLQRVAFLVGLTAWAGRTGGGAVTEQEITPLGPAFAAYHRRFRPQYVQDRTAKHFDTYSRGCCPTCLANRSNRSPSRSGPPSAPSRGSWSPGVNLVFDSRPGCAPSPMPGLPYASWTIDRLAAYLAAREGSDQADPDRRDRSLPQNSAE